ncbi:hypothetical protein F1541_02355 [Haemophilus influenzae biotype aegyptius]|nr:hypothetical protein F1541_02355 [Haemophilus influenzae biotype aegyptius]
MSLFVPFDGKPENHRAVESSKLANNRAELFPFGVVFLTLSTIDKKLLFLTALFAGTKKSR